MINGYVITGIGMISGVGMDTDECFANILGGKNSFSEITFEKYGPDYRGYYSCVNKESLLDLVDKKTLKRLYYNSAYGDVAAHEALEMAGLVKGERNIDDNEIGVCIGSTFAGAAAAEEENIKIMQKEKLGKKGRCTPYLSISMFQCAVAGNISIHNQLKGNIYSVVSGNAAGINAVIRSVRALDTGQSKIMLAGGSETPLSPYCITSVKSAIGSEGADIAKTAEYHPFSSSNKNIVLGEGCGIICIESEERVKERNRPVLGRICGFDSRIGSDMTRNLKKVIERSLEMAGLKSGDIDLLITYGGEKKTEKAEIEVIEELFGDNTDKVSITNSKHILGHCLGASSIMDIVLGIMCMKNSTVFTMGSGSKFGNKMDKSCVTDKAVRKEIKYFLTYSISYSGVVSAIIIGR